MKKKIVYGAGIAVVLLFSIILFFHPLSLSDTVDESNQIVMIWNEIGIRNGEPYIDSVDYQTVTEEQKCAILDLLEEYPYKRTVGTLFSDGSLSELGSETLSVYVYDDTSLICSIFITSAEKIVVNEKNYSMKNAEQLIEQVLEIMQIALVYKGECDV